MKRRKLLLCWTALHATISVITCLSLLGAHVTETAIVPPPWSDPTKNPCATMPGGWQLLYWPPLKQCFKIFTIGYPCPDTMELSPTATGGIKPKGTARNASAAECRCPPGTALSAQTNKCHQIFKRGPCALGQYFAPMSETMSVGSQSKRASNRWGSCRTPRACPDETLLWPKDGKCYTQYTKGPCAKGKLLVLNPDEGLAECKCDDADELRDYFYATEETCHEHYTKGPCSTPGHLFLPGGRCGCHRSLPHYYDDYQMCFELNTPGPCAPGHVFRVPDNASFASTAHVPRARCQCKDGYVPWTDGYCYRLYTRGPCGPNEFLINATTCIRNFCGKSRLYFPDQKSCYRIGSQGPCDLHQVVVFDFTARPSIDGIAYNGMCGCAGVIMNLDQQCSSAVTSNDAPAEGQAAGAGAITQGSTCESTPGMVEVNGQCHKLYSRGPCGPGQWLEPLKTHLPMVATAKAKCVCRPGYTRPEQGDDGVGDAGGGISMVQHCNAPSVGLARYLLSNYQRPNSKLGNMVLRDIRLKRSNFRLF